MVHTLHEVLCLIHERQARCLNSYVQAWEWDCVFTVTETINGDGKFECKIHTWEKWLLDASISTSAQCVYCLTWLYHPTWKNQSWCPAEFCFDSCTPPSHFLKAYLIGTSREGDIICQRQNIVQWIPGKRFWGCRPALTGQGSPQKEIQLRRFYKAPLNGFLISYPRTSESPLSSGDGYRVPLQTNWVALRDLNGCVLQKKTRPEKSNTIHERKLIAPVIH